MVRHDNEELRAERFADVEQEERFERRYGFPADYFDRNEEEDD